MSEHSSQTFKKHWAWGTWGRYYWPWFTFVPPFINRHRLLTIGRRLVLTIVYYWLPFSIDDRLLLVAV